MTTHTDETIGSAVVFACLLIALFAILLAAPLVPFDAYGRSLLRHRWNLLIRRVPRQRNDARPAVSIAARTLHVTRLPGHAAPRLKSARAQARQIAPSPRSIH